MGYWPASTGFEERAGVRRLSIVLYLTEETDVGCANPGEVSLATEDAETQTQSMAV